MRPVPDAHLLSREEMAKLVHRVFLLPRNESPRVVVFIGTEPRTGCTSICAGAAEALVAQVEGPVCIVDANLRFPSLHQCFAVENQRGLSDAVLKPGPIRDFARKLAGANLWLLSSGFMGSYLTSSLSMPRLTSRFSELRKEFPYVLIDAPPANAHADAVPLGRLADGAVLVLASNCTRREAARRTILSLQSAQVRILGAVLNKRTFPLPRFIYDRL
jgi:polysaccharide biosynthesis transport protein